MRRFYANSAPSERIIGMKAGTGGTAGVPYLRERLQLVLFPELWELRTEL